MSEIEEMKDNIIELADEDGNPIKFELLLTFDYNGSFYVAMLPQEPLEDMGEDEVLLMRIKEEDEEDVFYPIEDEKELEAVWQAFLDIYYSEEDEDEDPEEE